MFLSVDWVAVKGQGLLSGALAELKSSRPGGTVVIGVHLVPEKQCYFGCPRCGFKVRKFRAAHFENGATTRLKPLTLLIKSGRLFFSAQALLPLGCKTSQVPDQTVMRSNAFGAKPMMRVIREKARIDPAQGCATGIPASTIVTSAPVYACGCAVNAPMIPAPATIIFKDRSSWRSATGRVRCSNDSTRNHMQTGS